MDFSSGYQLLLFLIQVLCGMIVGILACVALHIQLRKIFINYYSRMEIDSFYTELKPKKDSPDLLAGPP